MQLVQLADISPDRELQHAQALQSVAEAEKAFERTERNLAIVTNIPAQDVIDQAYANMLLAENKLLKTHEKIEDVEWQFLKINSNNNNDNNERPSMRRTRRFSRSGYNSSVILRFLMFMRSS